MKSRPDRQHNGRLRNRLAQVAARFVAEDGISDFAQAKRKAMRHLGLSEQAALPDDDEVVAELRIYQRLFHGNEQQERSIDLLRRAASLMTILQRFNPYLTGPVLEGTAGRYAEIDIQLFPDSEKDVEIFLLDQDISYRHSAPRAERAVAVLTLVGEEAIVNLVVYPRDDERLIAKTRDGKIRERARIETVMALLASGLPQP